ncbi:MAG TPA: CheB methylesterase domain-containing protein [Desulfuromonadaceae bacterium]
MIPHNIVIIGVSTGGPIALRRLFADLPPLNAAIIVVLHIPQGMDYRIAKGLDAVSSMPVALAVNGEYLRAGHVYIAPGGYHLMLEGNHRIVMVEGERVNFVQPSVDLAMKSISRPLKGKIVGVVLTGMGKDGAEGIQHIKAIGGITMAQDQDSCAIFGMPKAAAETGVVDFVLSPEKMGKKLASILS